MPDQHAISNKDEKPGELSTGLADVIASNDASSADASDMRNPATTTSLAPSATVGSTLREARERQNMSAMDVASKLRMGLKQVTALEQSDFAVLPTGTFLRGFVRNYARAVSLNADDVLALLEQTHNAAAPVRASSVVVPTQQNIKVPVPGGELATPKGRALIFGIVGLLLLSAVWYWWQYVFPYRAEGGRTRPVASQPVAVSPPAATPDATPEPSATVVSTAVESTPSPAGTTPAEVIEKSLPPPVTTAVQQPAVTVTPPAASPVSTIPAIAAPKAAKPVETPATPVQATVAPAGSATLGFTFSGESWVRVTDATGKMVLSRLFKSGDAEEVVGRAPFSVLVGNAKATRMALDGREVALETAVNGVTSRMTVK